MTSSIEQVLRESRQAAEALLFPPFIGPERESTPLNGSPYVAHIDDLREGRFLSARGALVREFTAVLEELSAHCIRPVAALLGGSAIGPKPDPSDLDCVVFYEAVDGAVPSGDLRGLLTRSKARGIDMRLMPVDGDLVLLLKTVSYFSMLYSKNAGSLEIVRGLALIDCRER